MSDQQHRPTSNQPQDDLVAAGDPPIGAQGQSAKPVEAGADGTEASNTSLGDTTGTGTIVALGCIGATLFLIIIGLLYLGVTQLIG